MREKLLSGTGKLNKMDNDLVDIERQGHEAKDNMQHAN